MWYTRGKAAYQNVTTYLIQVAGLTQIGMKAKWLLQFALRCAPAMIVCVIKQPNALHCTSDEVLAEFLIKSMIILFGAQNNLLLRCRKRRQFS